MTKGFIIRDIPGWLFSHQDWISDNARKLLQAMVKLADTKTGNLLIPGRGWIRARAVERKANLCTRYRKTYMQELVRLGFVRWERPTVRRRIKNRLRAVRGGTHYTVLFHNIKTASVNAGSSTVHGKPNGEIASLDADLSQPEGTKQYEQGGSSTVQNDETMKSEPQNSSFSKVQSSTVSFENPSSDSSTVQSLHGARNAPTKTVSKAPFSTAASPLPSVSLLPLAHKGLGVVLDSPQAKPAAAQPAASALTPQPEDPDPLIDSFQSRSFWRHAKDHGWKKSDVQDYLLQHFNVLTPKHLTAAEYRTAIARTDHPPDH